jgi:hypothetical protein
MRFSAFLLLFAVTLQADPVVEAPAEGILKNYAAASGQHAASLRGASMEVDIKANLPKLKKTGKFHALRRISEIGRISYEAIRFEGDSAVKSNVIARYLTAETQAQENQDQLLAVTPENYKFKYKGLGVQDGREAYIFEVSPRKKRIGLYKGEIWIDSTTFLLLRERGRFVRNPSIFLKKVEFVRDYVIRDGVALPRRIYSVVETRIVGRAELAVDYRNVSLGSAQAALNPTGLPAESPNANPVSESSLF